MGRRTVLLLVAVLLAGLGTVMIFLYVQNADARAAQGQKLVKVLFAKTNITAGTKVSDAQASGAFELRDVAENSVSVGALSDTSAFSSKVVLTPIFAGQQIIAAEFGDPGTNTQLPIPAGKIAVSLQLGDPARVAGFVAPGNEVAVFITMSGQTSGNSGGQDFTRVLLPRVEVIATGPTTLVSTTTTNQATGQSNVEQLPKAILTLAVDQTEAQKIVYAQTKGQLYFGLLNAKSKIDTGNLTNLSNLFN